MKVLLTGATGAAGQYVLQSLMTTDHDVRVLALPDSMHRVHFRDRIEMVPGHIEDTTALREAAEGVELVYHTALARPTPTMSCEALEAINIEGSRRLVQAVAPSARRVVMITTAAVYAALPAPADWPVTDETERYPTGSPARLAHAGMLISAEDRFVEEAARAGIEHTILRPTLLGGRKAPEIEWLVALALRRPDLLEWQHRLHGIMQWVHGSDLGSAALIAGQDARAAGQGLLVAGDEPITLYDLQRILWDLFNIGRDDNPWADSASASNIGLRKFEALKLHSMGWRSRVPVREIVAEALGRLDFESSESLHLPNHLIREEGDDPPPRASLQDSTADQTA